MEILTIIAIVLLALNLVVEIIRLIYAFKGKSSDEIVDKIREYAKQLFLYAEKQEWISEEKLSYVTEQIIKKFPEYIGKYITEPVKEFVQSIYNEFTKDFKEYDSKLDTGEDYEDIGPDDVSEEIIIVDNEEIVPEEPKEVEESENSTEPKTVEDETEEATE